MVIPEDIENIFLLDAKTLDGTRYTTLFAETVELVVEHYLHWIKVHDIREKDVWYADIFDMATEKRVYKLTILPGGSVEINPTGPDDRVKIHKTGRLFEVVKRKLMKQ